MAQLAVRLFGPFQVTLGGDPVTGFRSDKVRALLAYLTVETEGPHRRERLAGLLWPDLPEQSARANLRRALSDLRKVIGDRQATPPFLEITRQTIQFNGASDAWVDVTAFARLLADRAQRYPKSKPAGQQAGQTTTQYLEEAIELYRGDFMEGFSLSDSAAFEEWGLLHRERLQRLVSEAMDHLSELYEGRGEVERALQYTWRQLELDPWRETAHQKVMRLLARSGQRGAALAQYESCRRLLAEELGVEPAAETTRLFEQIRDGELGIWESPPMAMTGLAMQLPPFLDTEVPAPMEQPVFVTRERELERMNELLEAALAGSGRALFVTGGAGRGKTALMWEFARRAMEAHPDLLVAGGNCNAHSGVGDPYLPFREVIGMLTGGVKARWAVGAITRKQAQRMWAVLPTAVQTLLNYSPQLVNVFVQGGALLARGQMAAPGGALWLARLRERVERERGEPGALEQSHLFQQVTQFLRSLAEAHPLLLILDDLQWADTATTSLLFHLGRRLEGNRILVIGAYRPTEVALGPDGSAEDWRQGETHPLGPVLSEFKRQFGDVWVDLTQADEIAGHRFVDAILDTEPNRLRRKFRRGLHEHTGGHPLFTIELLRAMQERGELVRDRDGHWIQGRALDWETLPRRVEGVIEERIGQLKPDLREILAVASVEGEEFTAQVVSRVKKVDEGQLMWQLAEDLERRHRLVREQGEIQIGQQFLSRYRFAHALFQSYLYNSLGKGVRRLLHREIARALEELYEGHPEAIGAIAGQLTRHYQGDSEKERYYARLAGERAAALFANKEALRYLSRALELTPEADNAERYALLLAREKVYDLQGEREAQSQDLAALEQLAETLGDERRKAEVAVRQANHAEATGAYSAAIATAQAAIRLAQACRATDLESMGFLQWGRSLWRLGDNDGARVQLEQALAVAQANGLRQAEADSLRNLGTAYHNQGDYPAARFHYEQSLHICRQINDLRGESGTLCNLGLASTEQGDLEEAQAYYAQALKIKQEIGDRQGESIILGNLGNVALQQSSYGEAKAYYDQALDICGEIEDRQGEGNMLSNLGLACYEQGDHAVARIYYEQALHIKQAIGDRLGEAIILSNLGLVFAEQGDYSAAQNYYERSLYIRQEIGDRRGEAFTLNNLADVRFCQGDYGGARAYFERALDICRDLGLRRLESLVLANLGAVRRRLGDDLLAHEYTQQALSMAQEFGDRRGQGIALTHLGHVLRDAGVLEEAADAYRQALDIMTELKQAKRTLEPLAGLAQVSLTQGELHQAQKCGERILSYLESGNLDGIDDPFWIYLTCYRVLQTSDDGRAAEVLETAYHLLQERAAKIEKEELRRSFLENVAAHREIMAEFAKR
jgi:adenylate cyclase